MRPIIFGQPADLDVILALPEEKQLAEVPSSFNSLYRTVLHMWDAESGYGSE
jgi:uncharacterized damage-inducible protein DinB